MALCGLSMDPAKRFKVLQIGVLWHLVWQTDILVGTNLRYHNYSSYFLDKWVVRRTYSVHEARNLNPKVTDADEPLEDILGEYIGVSSFLDVV